MFRRKMNGLTGLVFSVLVGGVVLTVAGDAGAEDSARAAAEKVDRPSVQFAMASLEPVDADVTPAPTAAGPQCCEFIGLCWYQTDVRNTIGLYRAPVRTTTRQ